MGMDWLRATTFFPRRNSSASVSSALSSSSTSDPHKRAAADTTAAMASGSVADALRRLLTGGGSGAGGSSSSARSHDTAALATLVKAGPSILTVAGPQQQQELAAVLIQCIQTQSKLHASSSSDSDNRRQCLLELELLRNISRSPNARLAQDDAVQALLAFVECSLKEAQGTGTQSANEADADMAMRTLNNVLMLQPDARTRFSSNTEIGTASTPNDQPSQASGAQLTARLLRVIAAQAPERAMLIFLAGRLLFFSTLFENPFVVQAIEEEHLVTSFSQCIEALKSSTTGEAAQAATELLKLAFNVTLYYPRLRPEQAQDWRDQHGSSIPAPVPSTPGSPTSAAPTAGEAWAAALDGLIAPTIDYFLARHAAMPSASAPLEAPMQQLVSLLLNIPTSASLAHSGAKHGSDAPEDSLIANLYELLARSLHRYFPDVKDGASMGLSIASLRYTNEDPDSETILNAARARAAKDGMGGTSGDPEVGLEPLVLLARKLVSEDASPQGSQRGRLTARQLFKQRLLPEDLDRSTPPHTQPTLSGLLIRLMSSAMFPRLGRAAGELLLAICNGSPKELSSTVGYGPAAGFLALTGSSLGVPESGSTRSFKTALSSPPAGSKKAARERTASASAHTSARPVDPITGRFADVTSAAEAEADAVLEAMSPQEREREAERLFVLFERLNRTGVVSVGNPATDPANRARVEELTAAEEVQEREREEARDEEEAMRDLEAYRKRRARPSAAE